MGGPSFSRRTAWVRTPNRLTEVRDELRRSGAEVLDLTASNPTEARLPEEAGRSARLQAALADPACATYAPDPAGLPGTREAVAGYYQSRGLPADPESVLLTASTSEAYASLFKLLADDGDRILVPRPSYPLFDHLAALEDVALDGYPLHHDGRWWIDLEEMERRVTPRTRAIMVVSPNNPTGSFVTEREWDGLQGIAARHGLAVAVDEVFSDYAFGDDPSRLASAASRPCAALTFVLSGLSKVVGLPQIKLGWMLAQGPPELVREAAARLEILLDSYLSVSTPAQVVARALLPSWRDLQEPILARVREGMSLVSRELDGGGIRVLPAEGGWCAVLRLPATRSEEDWALSLLREDRVLVHPGYFFDFSMEPVAVISLLTPGDVLRQGLARIATAAARAG